jgi:hypothetical protein
MKGYTLSPLRVVVGINVTRPKLYEYKNSQMHAESPKTKDAEKTERLCLMGHLISLIGVRSLIKNVA